MHESTQPPQNHTLFFLYTTTGESTGFSVAGTINTNTQHTYCDYTFFIHRVNDSVDKVDYSHYGSL